MLEAVVNEPPPGEPIKLLTEGARSEKISFPWKSIFATPETLNEGSTGIPLYLQSMAFSAWRFLDSTWPNTQIITTRAETAQPAAFKTRKNIVLGTGSLGPKYGGSAGRGRKNERAIVISCKCEYQYCEVDFFF